MNQRDLQLLSSYLDGQLKPSDFARLEARLTSDPNLRSVLDDLRAARGLLRQLPMRKAPRNFTLTPKMVGKNPPLPRAYPAFRFVTALAAVMLFFTFGVNFLAPQMAKPQAFGMGGGGAPPEAYSAQAPAAAATQAPAATEAPATEAPAQPSIGLAPAPTATPPAVEDTARAAATASEKNGAASETGPQNQAQDQNGFVQQAKAPQPVPPVWQLTLAGVVLLGVLVLLLMRRLATERWRK